MLKCVARKKGFGGVEGVCRALTHSHVRKCEDACVGSPAFTLLREHARGGAGRGREAPGESGRAPDAESRVPPALR